MEPLLKFILDTFFAFAGKYPMIASLLVIMASARAIIKPVITGLKAYAEASDTKKDDELVSKAEAHPAYKAVMFVLDYVFSIKKV